MNSYKNTKNKSFSLYIAIFIYFSFLFSQCDYSELHDNLVCEYVKDYIIEEFDPDVGCINQYQIPTGDDISDFRCHINNFLNNPILYTGEENLCSRNLSELGYEIIHYTDSNQTGEFRVFIETNITDSRDSFDKGWGVFVYNLDEDRKENVIIEVNHPNADVHTKWIGANIFGKTQSAWLFIAGAHRWACTENFPDEIDVEINIDTNYGADMAREEQSVFQVFHEEISNFNQGDIYAFSIHGFGDSYDTHFCTSEGISGAGIVISNGALDLNGDDNIEPTEIIEPSESTRILTSQFNSFIPNDDYIQPAVIVFDLFQYNYLNFDSLKASLNPQGKYTNSQFNVEPRWFHIEADTLIRDKNEDGGYRSEYYDAMDIAINDIYYSNTTNYDCLTYNTGECDLLYCDCSDSSEAIYDDGACSCSYDINGDGSVDILDIMSLINYILNSE